MTADRRLLVAVCSIALVTILTALYLASPVFAPAVLPAVWRVVRMDPASALRQE